jgi:hypothetical protein
MAKSERLRCPNSYAFIIEGLKARGHANTVSYSQRVASEGAEAGLDETTPEEPHPPGGRPIEPTDTQTSEARSHANSLCLIIAHGPVRPPRGEWPAVACRCTPDYAHLPLFRDCFLSPWTTTLANSIRLSSD